MLDSGEFHSLSAQRLKAGLSQSRLLVSPCLKNDDRLALLKLGWKELIVGKNESVIQDGGRGNRFCMLLDGWAYRYKLNRDGSCQIVGLLLAGDAVNLDSFVFEESEYGVAALAPSRFAMVPCSELRAAAWRRIGIVQAIAALAMVERSVLMQWSLCLGRKSAIQRVAHLLCEIAARAGIYDEMLRHPLTQAQMADMLGLTAIHINRTIKHLEHEGLIKAGRGQVAMLDYEGLAELADFDPAYLHLADQSAEPDFPILSHAARMSAGDGAAI